MKVIRNKRRITLDEILRQRDFSIGKGDKLAKFGRLIPPFYNELFKLLMLNISNDRKDFLHWCSETVPLINSVGKSRLFSNTKLFSPLIENNFKTIIRDPAFIENLINYFGGNMPKSIKEAGETVLEYNYNETLKGSRKYASLIDSIKRERSIDDSDLVDEFLRKIKYLVLIITKQINPGSVDFWDRSVDTKKVNWNYEIPELTANELKEYIKIVEDQVGY